MPSAKKVFLGAAGTLGAGIVAWRTLFPWISYDLKLIKIGMKAVKQVEKDLAAESFLICKFEEAVAKHPKKPFIIFEERIYSYEYMNEQVNRVANIASQWGLEVGDCVAILIENEPAFIWTFLGLQKLGIAVAFLNFHVRGQPLVHTIRACEAKVLIVGQGDDILHGVEEVRPLLNGMPIYVQGGSLMLGDGFQDWEELMRLAPPVPVCSSMREGVGLDTHCCYIFTSGTTGLPKPAVISQAKAMSISKFMQLIEFVPSDIIYMTTPLYHSAAGGLGLMGAIDQGATIVLRRKFSAQHYFEDVRRHNCTVIQYIGELCRYLLTVPESPLDGVHRVRSAIGNGLRADIWEKFKTRFKIPHINEFFGATEGSVALMNLNNITGSCGRLSPFLTKLDPHPKYLVKYDTVSGEAIRDKHGHCSQVDIDEPGLLVASVSPLNKDLNFYKGGREINEKKMIHNVFKEGDEYFNFGDILSVDKNYFVYFKDRIGDTFRWKGENVATYEVANVLTQLQFIEDANVYGVEIKGTEGRAGMAAIHVSENIPITKDLLQEIFDHCKEYLPNYARPLFLRFPKEAQLTVTWKQQKTQLKKEGFDPTVISDPLYFHDDIKQTYSPLNTENAAQLVKSKL